MIALLEHLDNEDRTAIALGDFECLVSRGLPAPRYVDSGTGLRGVEGSTAFPSGIALAATFDVELAEAYGAAVGAEARASGHNVVLGPTLDLARDPRAGRIPEALGEDPYLSGLLGAAHVRGLQAQHVIAQLKHYVAYNGEDRRTGYGLGDDRGDSMDVQVSTAVLHDVYLRPFEAAIEAGAWSMMGSYNRINGAYACESAEILAVPRTQWGWQGFYCPDFLFAVRDAERALSAGLDLGALGGAGGRTPEMVAAVPAEVVTALISNLVRALIGSGLVDHPLPENAEGPEPHEGPSTPEHLELAERCAVEAMVLLRNENGALPLGGDVTSIAVIGPSGSDAIYVTGGSASVGLVEGRVSTPMAGILAHAGDRRIEVSQGSFGDVPLPLVPASAFILPDGSGPGVEVQFVNADGATWLETAPLIDHTVPPADAAGRWPRRWRARVTSHATGAHRLSLTFGGRASVRLDGEQVMVGSRELEQFMHGPRYPMHVVVDLEAFVPALLEIDFEPGPAIAIPPMGLGPTLRLGWQLPDDLIDRAVGTAAACDAAVVLVNAACGEGMDRDSLALPGDQDKLVRLVAAANPRTVVVLNTPGAVMMPWLEDVGAVLQAWYPGERFGAALASVLFGDTEPGGRLPLTFPHARKDLPGGDHGPEAVPTHLDYDADGGIGYRAPAIREHGALFPFGHGLGYSDTRCELTATEVADDQVHLQLSVTNLGGRDTTHVAQVYAELGSGAPELVGLARVPVQPGATVTASLTVRPEAFARWDGGTERRAAVAGVYRLSLGTSSATLTQSISVIVEGEAITSIASSLEDSLEDRE